MRACVACASLAAMLALAGCSGNSPEVTASATPTPSMSATPSRESQDPTPTPTPDAPSESASPSRTPLPEPTSTAPSPQVPVLAGAAATLSRAEYSAGNGLLVGGYVVGIFEDGGTCTFTATPNVGGAAIVAETVGVANVDSTSCGSTKISSSLLASGSYSVTLTYANTAGQAVSAPAQVDVP